MSGFDRISQRLPHFYTYWDSRSLIASFIAAQGKWFDENEKDLVSIMRTHWVDTANGVHLDQIGEIFSVKRREAEPDKGYRNRLKTAIISYKGGGTIHAIQMLIRIALKLPQDYPLKIVENPPVSLKQTWKVSAGREWDINPRSIYVTIPDITLLVQTTDARVTNPVISNLTTGESISFKGDVSYGDVLKISRGKASLNDKDQTDKLSATVVPSLPRKKSHWQFMEYIGANMGTFDSAKFDQSVFVIEVQTSLTFEWQANQPATFELQLPRDLLSMSGIKIDTLQELLDSVKACGVKGEVRII